MKRETNKEMQAAGRIGSSSCKKADPELNCTDHQTQHSQESIFPDSESFLGITTSITSEVEVAADDVQETKPSTDTRMLHPTQYHQYEEHWHHFQGILVPSLNTVEDLGILVLRF